MNKEEKRALDDQAQMGSRTPRTFFASLIGVVAESY
jgi:hypothetical protein